MTSPEPTRAASRLREIGDLVERSLDQVEALLGADRLGEAVRILEANEGRLMRLWPAGFAPASGAGMTAPTVAGATPRPYAQAGDGERLRLADLLRRTGETLSRCEAMRARSAEELRALRARGRFEPQGEVARDWAWLDRRA